MLERIQVQDVDEGWALASILHKFHTIPLCILMYLDCARAIKSKGLAKYPILKKNMVTYLKDKQRLEIYVVPTLRNTDKTRMKIAEIPEVIDYMAYIGYVTMFKKSGPKVCLFNMDASAISLKKRLVSEREKQTIVSDEVANGFPIPKNAISRRIGLT